MRSAFCDVDAAGPCVARNTRRIASKLCVPPRPPPRPFVMWMTERTGSTWVIGMLDSHPSVVALPELYCNTAHACQALSASTIRAVLGGREHSACDALSRKQRFGRTVTALGLCTAGSQPGALKKLTLICPRSANPEVLGSRPATAAR